MAEKEEKKGNVIDRFEFFKKNILGLREDDNDLLNTVKDASPYGEIKDLSQFSEAFGGLNKLPTDYAPFQVKKDGRIDLKKNEKFFNIPGFESPTQTLQTNPLYDVKGLGQGEEIRRIPGQDKFEIVDKDAPGIGLPRLLSGFVDKLSRDTLDLDKRGKSGDKPRLFDISDPTNYQVSPATSKKIESELSKAGIDPKNQTDSLGNIKDRTRETIDAYKEFDKYESSKRNKQALEELRRQIPAQLMNQYFANRAGEIAQERLIRGAFQLEATPSNIQAISLSKQQQQAIPALAEAELLKAVAQQQEAANKFGLAGIQRTFGNIA